MAANKTHIEVQRIPFDDYTLFQVRFASVASKIPALLSLWGSIFIIYDILGTYEARQSRLRKAYYRIMLGLSISDCIVSFFGWFLSSWPQPKDTVHDNMLWGNVGNRDTCRAQGFIVEFGGLCTIQYTAMLTFYYLLIVKYKWKENKFRKIEPFMHFGIIGFSLSSAITILAADLFNTGMPFCYINTYPFWCEGADCIRGESADAYEMLLLIVPVLVCLIIILTSMGCIVLYVWRQERRMMRFAPNSLEHQDERMRLSKMAVKRALKYVIAYLLIWIPSTAHLMALQKLEKINIQRPGLIFSIDVALLLITPLQGLFNALIYTQSNLYMFAVRSISLFSCGKPEISSNASEL